MTRRAHRGRKGDGWPKPRPPSCALTIDAQTLVNARSRAQTYPDVCPRDMRCGHVICQIVWYCMEAA